MSTANNEIKRKFDRIDRTPVANPRYEGKTVIEIARGLLRVRKAQAEAS